MILPDGLRIPSEIQGMINEWKPNKSSALKDETLFVALLSDKDVGPVFFSYLINRNRVFKLTYEHAVDWAKADFQEAGKAKDYNSTPQHYFVASALIPWLTDNGLWQAA